MRIDIKAPRKQKDNPHKDARDFVASLTLKADDDMDELVLAAIADGIAYKKDKSFTKWLKSRLLSDMKRLNLRIAPTNSGEPPKGNP